jgi:APA family basic amino acid/polyamine antiporter
MGCISGVTVLYVLATLALVGMQPYGLISTSSGFSEAFRYNDVHWAAELVAVGELVTIPLVVLVSLIAQPRLQYAMAEDGLLPKIFSQVDERGTLFMVSAPITESCAGGMA